MRNWKEKAIIILGIFLIYTPAKAEILIYNKKAKEFKASGYEQPLSGVEDKHSRGFLVIEATYSEDGSISLLRNAVEISYGNLGGSLNWYWHEVREFEVAPVRLGNRLLWMIIERDYFYETKIFILKGWAKNVRIESNNREMRRIPKKLEGYNLSDQGVDYRTVRTIETVMRLNVDMTRFANEETGGNRDFDYMVDFIDSNLRSKGYNPL